MDKQEYILTDKNISDLKEIGKWTKWLSIGGFVFAGLFSIVSLFFFISLLFKAFSYYGDGNFFLIINSLMPFAVALVFLIPSYFLFKYSRAINDGLALKREAKLKDIFVYEKSFFKTLVIFLILFIVINAPIYILTGYEILRRLL